MSTLPVVVGTRTPPAVSHGGSGAKVEITTSSVLTYKVLFPSISTFETPPRVVAGEPEGLQQCFELQKDRIFAAPKDVGQDRAGVVIDGMPEPAGVAFVPDKRPHLIHLRLRFPRALQVPGHLGGVQRAQQSGYR